MKSIVEYVFGIRDPHYEETILMVKMRDESIVRKSSILACRVSQELIMPEEAKRICFIMTREYGWKWLKHKDIQQLYLINTPPPLYGDMNGPYTIVTGVAILCVIALPIIWKFFRKNV